MSSIFGPAGGGASVYDAIVATSGGDYTNLKDALDSGAKSVYIRNGTYNETGTVTNAENNLQIWGESSAAIVNIGANNFTFSGTNVKFCNFTLDSAAGVWALNGVESGLICCGLKKSTNTAARTITMGGNYAYICDCNIDDTNTSTATPHIYFTGAYSRFCSNTIQYEGGGTSPTNAYLYINGNYCLINGNNWIGGSSVTSGQITIYINNSNCTVSSNVVDGALREEFIYINGENNSVVGNTIYQVREGVVLKSPYNTVTGNNFETFSVYAVFNDSVDFSVISGNTCNGTLGKAIYLDTGSNGCVVTGNHCRRDLEINGTSNDNYVVGNTIQGNLTITDTAYNNVFNNNGATGGDSVAKEQYIVRGFNNSGGALALGDVVVYDANANGNYFTTTTTAADPKIFGMVTETINNGAEGFVLTKGSTIHLKVNGTTAIAVGDLLTTYTDAGIAAKAGTGDVAFARALEAYATADSNGVIDAILIDPRTA